MGVCICYGLAGYLDGTFNYSCLCHHRYFTKSRIYSNAKEQAAKEATDAAAKEAYYEDLNVSQENDVAASNSGKEMQQKRAADAVYAETVYAEAVYPASAESASEATLRLLILAKKKRMSVCNFCYNTHAGYLVTHVETVHYLCETCYHRYFRYFTDRHIYSVAKIKQNGRLDDSFPANSWEVLIKEWDVLDGDDADNFFDSDAFEIDDDLLDEDEKHYKNIIQAVLKWQYFKDRAEKEEAAAAAAKKAYELMKAVLEINLAASNSVKEQAAKKAAAAAAKEAYEDLNVVQEIDVATSISGKERQQERAAEAGYPASAESTSEATLRMLAKKRLSSKINDDVLEEVYNDLVASESTKRRESESHSDNDGNKRRESQYTFEIGELELEGYFDNGGSVRRRSLWRPNGRRGIRKPNGLRKCSRKLS